MAVLTRNACKYIRDPDLSNQSIIDLLDTIDAWILVAENLAKETGNIYNLDLLLRKAAEEHGTATR